MNQPFRFKNGSTLRIQGYGPWTIARVWWLAYKFDRKHGRNTR